MDLTKFVVEEPPRTRHNRSVWQQRFEEIIGQGLTGQWIDATEAWGLGPTNTTNAKRVAERCGLTLVTSISGKRFFICLK